MAAKGKTCLNRRPGKHSLLMIKAAPGQPFDPNDLFLSAAHADYDDHTSADWRTQGTVIAGDAKHIRIHLLGEKVSARRARRLRSRRRRPFDDDPVTGTLQITLDTLSGNTPPSVDNMVAVLFVDDGNGPGGC